MTSLSETLSVIPRKPVRWTEKVNFKPGKDVEVTLKVPAAKTVASR